MIKRLSILLAVTFSINLGYSNTYKTTELTIENVSKTKDRHFLFWKIRHQKTVIREKVKGSNNEIILSRKSIYLHSMDAIDTRVSRRLIIKDDKIIEYRIPRLFKNGSILTFDSDGHKISKVRKSKQDIFWDYEELKRTIANNGEHP